jgi:tetratricopeptide (TPR) repeat protein
MKNAIAILFLMQSVSAIAQEAPPSVQPSLAHGTEARAKKDFSGAEKEYRAALDAAGSHTESAYRSLFFLGLTKQEEASAAAAKGDAALASALRDAAADYYRKALEVQPASTAAILNLALVDIDRGKNDQAVVLLERGLELARQSNSASAAKFAERLGDLQTTAAKAIDYYRIASATGKASAALTAKIRKNLFVIAAANPDRQSDVVEYGWQLFGAGDIDGALDTALSAIDSEPPFSAASSSEMLTLATAALARKNYDGITFAGSDTVIRLQAMKHIPDALRSRVTSLFALYQGDIKDASALSIWKEEWDSQRPAARPASIQAIQQVARGLGYAAQRQRDFVNAERYYRLAIELDAAHPDAGTLRDLATLYYSLNRLPEIEQLMQQFETSLYEAKGIAYERVQWEQVAEYHRTLGTIYSWLHRDADARMQFEREFEAVNQENERRRETQRTDMLQIDSSTRLQYADTLTALNERERATSERLAVAEECASTGKIACVRDAVAHIDRADLKSPADQASFQKYLDASVKLHVSIDNSDILKSQLALFSSDANPAVRKQVEEALRRTFGITSILVENGHGTFQLGEQSIKFDVPVD